jgi:hypothetical protein
MGGVPYAHFGSTFHKGWIKSNKRIKKKVMRNIFCKFREKGGQKIYDGIRCKNKKIFFILSNHNLRGQFFLYILFY